MERFKAPVFVLLQNGLGIERDLYAAIEEAHSNEEAKGMVKEKAKIVTTALFIGTNMVGANVVEHNDFVSFLYT